MKGRTAAATLLLAAVAAGAAAEDHPDLTTPRRFSIERDVPVLPSPPPPVPSPAPSPLAAPAPSAPAPAPVPQVPPVPARPTPRPALPAPAATFTVQVGAFRTLEPARALADRLVSRGYDAFVVTVDLGTQGGQGTWHRVRVGRFPDRQPAAELAQRLADAERVPAQVLRETP